MLDNSYTKRDMYGMKVHKMERVQLRVINLLRLRNTYRVHAFADALSTETCHANDQPLDVATWYWLLMMDYEPK